MLDLVIGALKSPVVRPAANIQSVDLLGGWRKVEQRMGTKYGKYLRKFKTARLLILIDLDEDLDRRQTVLSWVDEDISDRVFLLSCLDEPEDLRRAVKLHLDEIGERMMSGCPTQRHEIWNHDHLRHNAEELDRFLASCAPILFA